MGKPAEYAGRATKPSTASASKCPRNLYPAPTTNVNAKATSTIPPATPSLFPTASNLQMESTATSAQMDISSPGDFASNLLNLTITTAIYSPSMEADVRPAI